MSEVTISEPVALISSLVVFAYLGIGGGIAFLSEPHTRARIWFGLLWPVLFPLTLTLYLFGGPKPWYLK